MLYIIYKISISGQDYIGSTKDLKQRKCRHKYCCNTKNSSKYHLKLYEFIRENGGWDKITISPIEEFECETKRQAECREEYWRREYKSNLNMIKAFRTEEELKLQQQISKKKTREIQKINEASKCNCGGCYKNSNKHNHLKTKKHQEYLINIKTPVMVSCIECSKLVNYDDAVYENDEAKDDCMLCIDCFNSI